MRAKKRTGKGRILLGIIVIIAICLFYLRSAYNSSVYLKEQTITIEKGDTIAKFYKDLHGVKKTMMKLWLKNHSKEIHLLQEGTYPIKEWKYTKQEFLDNLYDAKSYLQELIKEKKITKEDYYDHYLLPLKYGAVSMAVKTNAKIVPYAITGDYKFRGKNLVVNIGKPFTPDSDLEKANDRLDVTGIIKRKLGSAGFIVFPKFPCKSIAFLKFSTELLYFFSSLSNIPSMKYASASCGSFSSAFLKYL